MKIKAKKSLKDFSKEEIEIYNSVAATINSFIDNAELEGDDDVSPRLPCIVYGEGGPVCFNCRTGKLVKCPGT